MYLEEHHTPAPPLLFKRDGESGLTGVLPGEQGKVETEKRRAYVCRFCGHVITFPEMTILINGSNRHVFTNPAGIVYEISCFSAAAGCTVAGEPTPEFTWFPGFLWRYALCSGCRNHMGWQYLREGAIFYGLVADYLAENQ
ncbi:MAG: hypothetical protein JXA20_20500 [Spirochaetes bacterium]|nr:hypothetical protein [Spirochaetota bacterium]